MAATSSGVTRTVPQNTNWRTNRGSRAEKTVLVVSSVAGMKRSNKKEHFCSLKLLAANRENAGAYPSIQAGPAATLGVRNPKFHIPQGCLCASAGMVRSGWHLKPGWGVHQGRREGQFSAGSQLWLQRISPKRNLPLFLLRLFPPRVRAVHAEPALSCEFTPRNQK